MMRSMNSAVTSLRNHQTRMDVIGNNIANVNTVSFKGGRVTFKDTYSQNIRTATGPQEQRGGLNPHQVGLGMKIGSIDNNMTRGTIDTTGIGTDVFIEGEGWFRVESPDGVFYTRDGSFDFDGQGYLVTKGGHFVQGYIANDMGDITEEMGKIKLPINDVLDPKVTSMIKLKGNVDSRAGNGIPDDEDIPNTIEELYDIIDMPNGKKRYELKSKWQNNEKEGRTSILGATVPITAIDSLGKDVHHMELQFVKNDDGGENVWNVFAFYKDTKTNAMVPAVSNQGGAGFGAGTAGAGFAGTVSFTNHGRNIEVQGSDSPTLKFTLQASALTGAADLEFSVDLKDLTQFESPQEVQVEKNDGYPLGKLTGYMIAGDGKVLGTFDNGLTKVFGQIATATFANDNGLEKKGDNLWVPSLNSGEPSIGKPGEGKRGLLRSGALERSNVDLAAEFTDMIITQRGFQANARTITTTDQMLEELVNLKR